MLSAVGAVHLNRLESVCGSVERRLRSLAHTC